MPLRDVVAQIPAYVPGARSVDAGVHRLASNENPYPPLDSVREVVERAAAGFHRYPDMFATELSEAIAAKHGVDVASVVAGCGSVAVLGHVLQAFCDAGDRVVYAWRAFEAYPITVRLQGAVPVEVPLTSDGRHDLPAMAAAVDERTRAVLVCSPNNPTGPAVRHTELSALLAAVPEHVLVVLDEAYVEFVRQPDAVDADRLLAEHPNLVVLRTFSKAYGLAGLRIGYAVGPEYVLDAARSTAIPMSVTEQAQLAALAALEHENVLLERVASIAALREEVWSALVAQGWPVPRSHGNFVWLPTGAATESAADRFAAAGLIVRAFHPEGIRVTIGEAASVETLLRVSGEVVRNLRKHGGTTGLD